MAGLLEQKVIVVSFFGKSPYSAGGCKAGLIDGFPGRRVFHTSLIDDPDVDQELLVRSITAVCVPYCPLFKCLSLCQVFHGLDPSKFQRPLLYQLFRTVPHFSPHSIHFLLIGSMDKRARTFN